MIALQPSRSLDDLQPHMKLLAQQLLATATAAGIPLTVTCTLRSLELQAALYARGRTAPGKIVTNAKPGFSYHNFGLAIDVVPTELLALPHWGEMPEHRIATAALWVKLGTIGKAVGLRWGGDFPHFPDRPHFEWSADMSLAQLRAGERPAAPAHDQLKKENDDEKDFGSTRNCHRGCIGSVGCSSLC